MMRSFTLLALLFAFVSLAVSVTAQEMQVETGSTCVSAYVGQCVPCTQDGTKSYLYLKAYDRGVLTSVLTTSSSCNGDGDEEKSMAKPCDQLSPCQAAPAFISVLTVSTAAPLSVMYGDQEGRTTFAYMNQTTGSMSGAISNMIVTTGSGYVRYINQYDNGDYLTNHGVCQIGTPCVQGDYSLELVNIPISELPFQSENISKLAEAAAGGNWSVDLVSFKPGVFGYKISTNVDGVLFALDSYSVVVNANDLNKILITINEDTVFSDMQRENPDKDSQNVIAKVTTSDFVTYTDTVCDVYVPSDPIQFLLSDVPVAMCSFNYFGSGGVPEIDLGTMFPGFVPEHKKEAPAFSLF